MTNNTFVIPEAFFDSLSLAKKLDEFLDGFKTEEIQLFAYFSLILHVYNGGDVASWGYGFIVDEKGYPFSVALNSAIERHLKNGIFEDKKDYYIMTGRGVDEFNRFKKLSDFANREKMANASCTTSILIPFSETRKALLNDPNLVKAKLLGGKRAIDDAVYVQFQEITNAIGAPVDDVIIPAISWINYINAKEEAGGES
ncbi:hypothetical protein [Butyricimonas paravirosa]|uniref:hypothetical protein n=1 Tax=Butyricimonas paravirosa TaxID=1472417 RepID=UPI00210922AE|nr:hypothetical protein [Butyricimonas paravirosa]MCQ4875074.1 hypothetical protein [Butyricimonas paravirosa]